MVKCVSGLYWLYFMIIYDSATTTACLRERKLTGRKCLKQKWLKKEEFLRRVGGSRFAENRARISQEQAETLWSGQIWGLGGQPNALLLLKSYWKARFTLFRAAWVLILRRGCGGFTWKRVSQKAEGWKKRTYCETRSPPYQDGCRMLGQLPYRHRTDAAKLLPVSGSSLD